jgi:hypothetical protein
MLKAENIDSTSNRTAINRDMNDTSKMKRDKHVSFGDPASLNNSGHLQCFCLKPVRKFVTFRIMTPNQNLSVIRTKCCVNYLRNKNIFVSLLVHCAMAIKCFVNGITVDTKP